MMTLGALRGLIAVLRLVIKQRESLAPASPADSRGGREQAGFKLVDAFGP
jgi:hypothetical protein